MLNVLKVNDVFKDLALPPAGRRLVEDARQFAPVREVKSKVGNVITLYQSKKMDRTIATESHTVELPAVTLMEADPAVLEYYPQPCRLDLTLFTEKRKKHRYPYVPDFLIIKDDGVFIEEWKTEEELLRKAGKQPYRYVKNNDGSWGSPQIERMLAEKGISYRLRSSAEIPQLYLENIEFLEDYFDKACPPVPEKKIQLLWDLLKESPMQNIGALIHDEGIDLSADEIFKAIADGQVIANLNKEQLSKAASANIYRDEAVMEYYAVSRQSTSLEAVPRLDCVITDGTVINLNGVIYTVAYAGPQECFITDGRTSKRMNPTILEQMFQDGALEVLNQQEELAEISGLVPELKDVSHEELAYAVIRKEILQNGELSEETLKTLDIDASERRSFTLRPAPRTVRRWRNRERTASKIGADELLILVPEIRKRGNKIPRLDGELYDLMKEVYENFYDEARNRKIMACYRELEGLCNSKSLAPPSYKTLAKYIRARRLADGGAENRNGKRIQYKNKPFVLNLEYRTSVHGVRPFQVCHIDHTELDIELISSETGENFGRPWLTLAIDAFSRRIIGFYISYEGPSYRSCMSVIRDIVRRHGRMPKTFVVDNGKEFHSLDFLILARSYNCSIKYRPSAQARFGAVLERLFGVINQEFIHNLAGNTQLMKHVREVTKSVNPKNLAEWTLEKLYHAIEYWNIAIYEEDPHPALNMLTPRSAFEKEIINTGSRNHKFVRYDRNFMIITCPLVKGDTRVVSARTGIKIDHTYYRPIEPFGHMDGKTVRIKQDPWDMRVVYMWMRVKISNDSDAEFVEQWFTCYSKYYGLQRPLSAVEHRMFREEFLRQYKDQKKDFSPDRFARWVTLYDIKNFDDPVVAKQREMGFLYGQLGMTAVECQEEKQSFVPERKGILRTMEKTVPKFVEAIDDEEIICAKEEPFYGLF